MYSSLKLIFIVFGSNLGTFQYAIPELATFLAFGMGLGLFSLLSESVRMSPKPTLLLSLGGALGAVATGVGDKLYFMNRDTRTWLYATEGAVAVLLALAYLLLMCETRF